MSNFLLFILGLLAILLAAFVIGFIMLWTWTVIQTEFEDRKNNPEPFKYEVGDLVSLNKWAIYSPWLYTTWGSRTRKTMLTFLSNPREISSRAYIDGEPCYSLVGCPVFRSIPECWLKLDYSRE